jgi:uncharacterized protein YndB with AHSA1/START domain
VSKSRRIETEIEIDASIEAVWKAISEGTELTRWLPLDARTKPGPGGSVWYSWGPPYEGESRIEIWDPPHRLRLEGGWSEPIEGEPAREVEPGVPARLAMDYTLESAGGKTILRLVHSGFGAGSDWDDEYEGTRRGWMQEFLSLKHYLERHAGHDRKAVWARRRVAASVEEVSRRLLGALNLEGLEQGESFDRVTSQGDRLKGKVLVHRPPQDFIAILDNLNDAFLRVTVEKFSVPARHIEPNIWLSTYGVLNNRVMSFQINWTKLLIELFPQEFKE